MLIDIIQLQNGQTEQIDIAIEISPAKWAVKFHSFALSGPTLFKGTLTAGGRDEYLLAGRLSGRIKAECSRCLKAVTEEFLILVREVYLKETKEQSADADVYVFDQKIDLIPTLRDNLVLSLPARFCCREDCRGLCPGCGVNLNEETCTCRPESFGKSPFSDLEQLIKQ